MKHTCAWCGEEIEGSLAETENSHGICEKCLRKELAELEKLKEVKSVIQRKGE